ncbi:MAG: hypothetical protein ACPG7F_09075 [Aggregatilineales bacterium]
MADYYSKTDGHIKIFKFVRSTDAAVEAWAADLDAYLSQHPPGDPFYILLDVSGDNVGFTTAARQNSKHLFDKYRDRDGYIAMLFSGRTSPYFARLFFASLGKLNVKLDYFAHPQKARAWLHLR